MPVITDAKKVMHGLRWAIQEMEARYKLFARAGVRNIKSFNAKYPKVKITTSLAAYKDYWTKLRTQAGGGDAALTPVFLRLTGGHGLREIEDAP